MHLSHAEYAAETKANKLTRTWRSSRFVLGSQKANVTEIESDITLHYVSGKKKDMPEDRKNHKPHDSI